MYICLHKEHRIQIFPFFFLFQHFFSLFFSAIIQGLRDVKVTVPGAVRRGENAVLICLYDMEGDSLYSVKWYKGRREFYRFTPKENPAMKTFPIPGINVVVSNFAFYMFVYLLFQLLHES